MVLHKQSPKFICVHKWVERAKKNIKKIKKENEMAGSASPDQKTTYKSIVIKTVWYCRRHESQNRLKHAMPDSRHACIACQGLTLWSPYHVPGVAIRVSCCLSRSRKIPASNAKTHAGEDTRPGLQSGGFSLGRGGTCLGFHLLGGEDGKTRSSRSFLSTW